MRDRKERAGKLGVFWHTQGAGKSYSIVFFTQKVHRRIGANFTFLILTDRDDLNSQIYKTFAGCRVVSGFIPLSGISPPNRQSAKPLNPMSTKSEEGH